MNGTFINGLLGDLWTDLHDVNVLWQLGVLLLCLGLAWLAARGFKSTQRGAAGDGPWRVGISSATRLAFPLTALVLVLVARPILGHWQHVNLLSLAVPLLVSLGAIRMAVYALRRALGDSGLVAVFERILVMVIFAWVALYILGLLPDIVDLLRSVSMEVGKQKVTLWQALQAIFWVAVTLLASFWLGGVIDAWLMRADSLHSSLRAVLARIVNIVLVFAAILISLPMVGIDVTVLSVFGGALGVGVGFGLQRIASNYISGFIILLDRSIRMGDMISVNDRSGVVTNITTRYTVVKALDGTEAIVPNDTMTSSVVLNFAYSDRNTRLATQMQVAYDSDLDAVFKLLVEIAKRHPRVLAEPEPQAYLVKFADSGILLELGFWVLDPEQGSLNIKSDLNMEIWREFNKRKIEFPFPQMEVRMHTAPEPGSSPENPV
jgi:small-conductance mechanosensitive channel